MTFLIVVVVIVLVALLLGYHYDRKHRVLGDSDSSRSIRRKARATGLDSQEKSTRWGAGL